MFFKMLAFNAIVYEDSNVLSSAFPEEPCCTSLGMVSRDQMSSLEFLSSWEAKWPVAASKDLGGTWPSSIRSCLGEPLHVAIQIKGKERLVISEGQSQHV